LLWRQSVPQERVHDEEDEEARDMIYRLPRSRVQDRRRGIKVRNAPTDKTGSVIGDRT